MYNVKVCLFIYFNMQDMCKTFLLLKLSTTVLEFEYSAPIGHNN